MNQILNKTEITNEHYLDTIFTESVKANMANEWCNSRSVGNREQDRDCYYDYLNGIEDAIKVLSKII